MSFRNNLQHLRSTRNMTQEQLAMLLGVSRQSVTKWEAEKSYPEMDKLLKLCEIFGCTLDDLVTGDLTDRDVAPSDSVDPDAPVTDICGYDEERRSFARSVSWAVACFILGPAATCLITTAGSDIGGVTGLVDAAGVVALLALVAAGLALVIPAGLSHTAFVCQHPFIEDFYTEEDRTQGRIRFTRSLVGGILLILLGVALCVLLDQALPVAYQTVAAAALLTCVAFGVRSIVNGSMLWAGLDIDAYNEQAQGFEGSDRGPGPRGRRQRMTDGLCGAVMLVATIAGLVMLFVPGYQTPFFWLAWPIGGISCGIVSCLVQAFGPSDE